MSISTIRAIIKKFQSTENVMNLPGRGRESTSGILKSGPFLQSLALTLIKHLSMLISLQDH